MSHVEKHKSHRTGWLRAAVLGANDGIISVSSLMIGIAAAGTSQESILVSGVAGVVAGAMSMAAGEYVSVSSQADTEKADLLMEKDSLDKHYDSEKEELAGIYESRGLEPKLAMAVAEQLMEHDALGAHARDDIGILENSAARPIQAAIFSAVAFTIGASFPILVVLLISQNLIATIAISSLLFLMLLGAVAARVGGASMTIGAFRVAFWGAFAMALTAVIGHLFHASI